MKFVTLARAIVAACLISCAAQAQTVMNANPEAFPIYKGARAMPVVCVDASGNYLGCSGPIPAGGNQIGYVGGSNNVVTATPTIQAAAYASGNAIGALQTVSIFRSTTQPSGILSQVMTNWKGAETPGVTFYIYSANPTGTTCTDKTAFVEGAADITKRVTTPFTMTAAATTGTTTTGASQSFALSVKNTDGTPTTNLYVCAVSNGAFTPAVGDFTFALSAVTD